MSHCEVCLKTQAQNCQDLFRAVTRCNKSLVSRSNANAETSTRRQGSVISDSCRKRMRFEMVQKCWLAGCREGKGDGRMDRVLQNGFLQKGHFKETNSKNMARYLVRLKTIITFPNTVFYPPIIFLSTISMLMCICSVFWSWLLTVSASELKSNECSCKRYANAVILHVDIMRPTSIYAVTPNAVHFEIYIHTYVAGIRWEHRLPDNATNSRYSLITE